MKISRGIAAAAVVLTLTGCSGGGTPEATTVTVTETATATVTATVTAEATQGAVPGELQVLGVQSVWDTLTADEVETVCAEWERDPDSAVAVFIDSGLNVTPEAVKVVLLDECD